jgi:hypothetical protein
MKLRLQKLKSMRSKKEYIHVHTYMYAYYLNIKCRKDYVTVIMP